MEISASREGRAISKLDAQIAALFDNSQSLTYKKLKEYVKVSDEAMKRRRDYGRRDAYKRRHSPETREAYLRYQREYMRDYRARQKEAQNGGDR